jgi:hypothetical protein
MCLVKSQLLQHLADERSKRVIFVSHCLLNENTRYLGGAYRRGCVDEFVDGFQRQGLGLYQMPCPEQRAWGGVLKRAILPMYCSRGTLRYRFRAVLLPLFLAYTRWRYSRLAAMVARDIEDYARSGCEVVGVVGVDGSPSCGVWTTLDLHRSLDVIAQCPLARLDRQTLTQEAIVACRHSGVGLFVTALQRRLRRNRLRIPFYAHDLLDEIRGLPTRLRTQEHDVLRRKLSASGGPPDASAAELSYDPGGVS